MMMAGTKARKLLALLEKAAHDCVHRADKTALQLSGGLDSAVLQAILKLDNCYCCTWPEVDNLSMAQLAACGKDVHVVTFSKEQMIEEALPDVAKITHGRGTWSQCCQWYMAKQMAADGMEAEMNGEGSDEQFGGYARYRILWWLEQMTRDPHLQEYQGIVRFVLGDRQNWITRMAHRTDQSAVLPEVSGALTDQMGRHDENVGLAELIGFEGAIASAHGLVHRWPYRDEAVVAFAHELDEGDKITWYESKHILREVARLLGVHPAIIGEVTKRGLFVPTEWRREGEEKWSRAWFDELMAEELHRKRWQRLDRYLPCNLDGRLRP